MDDLLPVIVGAAVGAIITAAGWFVSEWSYHRRLRKEATLRQIERQIEELYGPLLGLIRYSGSVYKVAAIVLPSVDNKQEVVDQSRFNDDNWETWRFLTDAYFHPTNAKVRELLLSKMHLLKPGDGLSSLDDFLEHAAHSECRFRLWRERNIDTSQMPGPAYPRGFEEEVEHALRDLRARRQECLRSLGVTRARSGVSAR